MFKERDLFGMSWNFSMSSTTNNRVC